MDYYVYNIDEYSEDSRQGNEFAPAWNFRLLVSGCSDSGKTTMLMNLLKGNKNLKEDGERYIRCNDVLLIGKHLDEPKWVIVKNFFDELAREGEDVSFKALPAIDIPELDSFDPSRATVVIFEDLMNEPKKIQDRIAKYFSSGRHRNISSIYVSQRFFLTPKTIRENITHISLHRGAGSLADIKRILSLYTEHSDSIAPMIDDLTRKKEFIIFDHRRPRDDPLSIRVRWDTSLNSILNDTSLIGSISDNILDGLKHLKVDESKTTKPLLETTESLPKSVALDPIDITSTPIKVDYCSNPSKFNLYGQKVIKDAKGNGTLVDIAKNMPSPNERKKLLARGVQTKNSIIWAKYVYREAFNIRDKDLGPDWVKFTASMK